jgi:hypothetical protein
MRWMEHYLVGEGGEPPAYQLDYGFGNGSSSEESGDDD